MRQDSITYAHISKGKFCFSKPLPIYIALDKKIEKKYNAYSSLINLCKSIIYLISSQVDSGQYLANFVTCQAPISLCYFSRN